MATVRILEPDDELRELFRHVVRRLGHEPLITDGTENAPSPDLILLEPASRVALRRATALRARQPSVPIVCASIEPPGDEVAKLRPVNYLLKPFSMYELESALAAALVAPARTPSSR